jgi:hypothetical protein
MHNISYHVHQALHQPVPRSGRLIYHALVNGRHIYASTTRAHRRPSDNRIKVKKTHSAPTGGRHCHEHKSTHAHSDGRASRKKNQTDICTGDTNQPAPAQQRTRRQAWTIRIVITHMEPGNTVTRSAEHPGRAHTDTRCFRLQRAQQVKSVPTAVHALDKSI